MLLQSPSSTFLKGVNRSDRTTWREETFSLSWEFSWRVWWLLSSKWITFSESWWFMFWSWLTRYRRSSICFFLRIRDLRADSLLDIILLSFFSLEMSSCWSLGSARVESVLTDDVFGERTWSGTWIRELVKNLSKRLELDSGFSDIFAWVGVWLVDSTMGCIFRLAAEGYCFCMGLGKVNRLWTKFAWGRPWNFLISCGSMAIIDHWLEHKTDWRKELSF